uniref:Uncharacterized protein n=1 Tax=Marmota marmota marmota TaxID=9994 RepID=A0A8C5Z010_MARMA
MQHSCFLGGSHIHIADLTSASVPRLLFHSLLYGYLFCKENKNKTNKQTKKKAKHEKAKQNKKKTENKNKKNQHKIVTIISVCPSCESY